MIFLIEHNSIDIDYQLLYNRIYFGTLPAPPWVLQQQYTGFPVSTRVPVMCKRDQRSWEIWVTIDNT